MKFIRFLILIAIVVLVALAFLYRSPENADQQDLVNAFMQPLQDVQQNIEQHYPELRSDLEKLKSQIQEKIAGIDPKNLIPIQIPASGSSIAAELQSSPVESTTAPLETSEVKKEVQTLTDNLKNMDAKELAQKVKDLYEKLQQYTQEPDTQKPGEESTPATE